MMLLVILKEPPFWTEIVCVSFIVNIRLRYLATGDEIC